MFGDGIKLTIWPIEKMTGYKPVTTFWNDFEIAEVCGGEEAIKDTYKRGMKYWSWDVKMVTELAMVVNWRMFYWFDRKNYKLARLYEKLWVDCDKWCMKNLKDDDLTYYVRTTD